MKEAKRAQVDYDDEDVNAQKAPSLMQSMMELNPEGGDSDDELSGDETTVASNKAAEAKKD